MASGRKSKRRRRGAKPKGTPKRARNLRRLDEPLEDWRYEPKPSIKDYAAVGVMSAGGLSLGIGTYGVWLRAEPLSYAPYLLGLGAVLALLYVLFARHSAQALRVGELGIGIERDQRSIDRCDWHQLRKADLRGDTLELEFESEALKSLRLPLAQHGPAVSRIVDEAHQRVPDRIDLDETERERIGEPSSDRGEKLPVDPPQVTGKRCMASDEPLTIERDARRCSRCGALFHKSAVPKRCVGCDAPLRGGG